MSHISTRASGGFPLDFVSFSVSEALYFPLDAWLDMQHNDYPPYPPNSMANANTYLHTSPNPEQQSPHSYADPHQYNSSQFPSSHPNHNQYYAGLGSARLYNQELGWGSGMQQPYESHIADIPHQSRGIPPEYSRHSYAPQYPPANPSYPLNEDLSYSGAVDPNNGMIFYPSTEGPRLRTAQAYQKCRARKAKVISSTLWVMRLV